MNFTFKFKRFTTFGKKIFTKQNEGVVLRRASSILGIPGALALFSTDLREGISNAMSAPIKRPWTLSASVFSAPKTLKTIKEGDMVVVEVEQCGEDAAVIVENDVQIVLALADGVGGWREKGVDPSAFSRSLIRHLEAIVAGCPEPMGHLFERLKTSMVDQPGAISITQPLRPFTLIGNAFWRMIRSHSRGRERPFGSSTVCVLSLEKATGELDTANLGDSGFIVIRGGDVIVKSVAQQHRFNAPYQLTLAPDGNISDCSKMAHASVTEVHAGDIIVVATDGLWDNLFEDDIVALCERSKSARRMAVDLVKQARSQSKMVDYQSPFSVEAAKHGKNRMGGKEDDITVIVAIVQYDDS